MTSDPASCPSSYIVLFQGISRQTISPERFIQHKWYHGLITAKWTLEDEGMYLVYAYPEFMFCNRWERKDVFWNAAAVQTTPLKITVLPPKNPREIGYGTCSAAQIPWGRYLSTSSNTLSKISDSSSNRKFIWTPFACKIPMRTTLQALDSLPSAQHILFVGDSTTRGPFCALVWKQLHGSIQGGVCDFESNSQGYRDDKWGHKYTFKVLEHSGRNISVSFLWVPYEQALQPFYEELEKLPPPTHIVFNLGLYFPQARLPLIEDGSTEKM